MPTTTTTSTSTSVPASDPGNETIGVTDEVTIVIIDPEE